MCRSAERHIWEGIWMKVWKLNLTLQTRPNDMYFQATLLLMWKEMIPGGRFLTTTEFWDCLILQTTFKQWCITKWAPQEFDISYAVIQTLFTTFQQFLLFSHLHMLERNQKVKQNDSKSADSYQHLCRSRSFTWHNLTLSMPSVLYHKMGPPRVWYVVCFNSYIVK